jgi:DNA modification methylase
VRVELFVRPIELHTRPVDTVDEPFSSGTQLIAAEQTGRFCYAMERELCYVDVASPKVGEL